MRCVCMLPQQLVRCDCSQFFPLGYASKGVQDFGVVVVCSVGFELQGERRLTC